MRRADRQMPALRVGTRRELALLVGIGFVMTLLIGVGAVFASRSVARQQALEDSERLTERLARIVIVPLWNGYLSGAQTGVGALQQAVLQRMEDGRLTSVTVWSSDGRVLFSDAPENVGKDFETPVHLAAALRGDITSDIRQDQPGARAPSGGTSGGANRFVEVFAPLDVPGKPRMVFEAHYDHQQVDRLANQLLVQILPLVLLPLLVLQLVQIPIAISLARRIKRHEHDRSRLLERALSVSERERVRFAADLHDGPIQDLAGISYALGAIAPAVPERHTPLMSRVQDALQRAIQSLRGLMTDLYPPDLDSCNLGQTLTSLSDPLRSQGVEVQLDLREVPPLGDDATATLYRVARESLTNVQKHAQATTVRIGLDVVEGPRGTNEPWVRLVVADDGVGVDPGRMDRRAEGHLGLRLLVDRVESLGGKLLVTSAVGHGTTVQTDLPVRPRTED